VHRTTKISKSNIQYISEIELKSRPPPNIVDVELSRMSALEEFAKAIECGDSSIVESLISNGLVDVNEHLPLYHRPALILAAERGQKDIVDILLRANARIDDVDEQGWTACYAAADGGHPDVLALLLASRISTL